MNDQDIRSKMEKSIKALEENLRKLRTGRASATLLEGIKVEAYGTTMPLEQLSNISILDFKTMMVQPWDKSNADAIVKAVGAANLGMTPVKDMDVIRISIPELTQERRKELTKVVGTYEEEARIALRQVRKEIIEGFKHDKEATEDDVRSITDTVDKFIKEYNEKIGQLCDKKRDEMMQV